MRLSCKKMVHESTKLFGRITQVPLMTMREIPLCFLHTILLLSITIHIKGMFFLTHVIATDHDQTRGRVSKPSTPNGECRFSSRCTNTSILDSTPARKQWSAPS